MVSAESAARKATTQESESPTSPNIKVQLHEELEKLIQYVSQQNGTFCELEKGLVPRIAQIGCLLIALFLAMRHEKLNIKDPNSMQLLYTTNCKNL